MQESIFETERSLWLEWSTFLIGRVFVVIVDIVVELWRRLNGTIGIFSILKVLPIIIPNFRLFLNRLSWRYYSALLVVFKDALPSPFPVLTFFDLLNA